MGIGPDKCSSQHSGGGGGWSQDLSCLVFQAHPLLGVPFPASLIGIISLRTFSPVTAFVVFSSTF